MKRKIIMGILMMGILCFAACGKESSSDTAVQAEVQEEKEEVKEEKKSSKKGEISMEALREHEESPVSDFQFRLADGNYEIDKYLGNDEIVVVPAEYEGKKVVGVVSLVFGKDSGVKAVRLPDSVEYLAGSFMENKELEYVICGSGLKEIRKLTFSGCSSLKELELNEGLEKIESTTFSGLKSLKELYIPGSVTEFGPGNFNAMSDHGFVIKGKAGSAAETYVIEEGEPQYGHTFVAVE